MTTPSDKQEGESMSTIQWIELVVGLFIGSVMVVAAYCYLHNDAPKSTKTDSENENDKE